MVPVLEVALVLAFSGPRLLVLALEESVGDPLALARHLVGRLVGPHIPTYLADPLLYLVVLWVSFAGGLALWWVVRGITIWIKEPRVQKSKPIPSPTAQERMTQATDRYTLRLELIDLSALADDARKQARQEAERQYMAEVKEVLRCQ